MHVGLRKKIKRVMLVTPPGKIAVTFKGSRERKLISRSAWPTWPRVCAGPGSTSRPDVLIEGYETETVTENIVTYGLLESQIRSGSAPSIPIAGSAPLLEPQARSLPLQNRQEEIPDAYVIMGSQHPSGLPFDGLARTST